MSIKKETQEKLEIIKSLIGRYIDVNRLLNSLSLPNNKVIKLPFDEIISKIEKQEIKDIEKYLLVNYQLRTYIETQSEEYIKVSFEEYYEKACEKLFDLWENGLIGDEYPYEDGDWVSRTPRFCKNLNLIQRIVKPSGTETEGRVDKFRAELINEASSSDLYNPGSIIVYLDSEILLNNPDLLIDTDNVIVDYVLKNVVLLQASSAPGNYLVFDSKSNNTKNLLYNCFINEDAINNMELLPPVRLVESRTPRLNRQERAELVNINTTRLNPNNFQAILRESNKNQTTIQEIISNRLLPNKEEKPINLLSPKYEISNEEEEEYDDNDSKENKKDKSKEDNIPFDIDNISIEY
ncbi:hypothetical protein V6O07_23865 [Arthrospira platensis SPKY2]